MKLNRKIQYRLLDRNIRYSYLDGIAFSFMLGSDFSLYWPLPAPFSRLPRDGESGLVPPADYHQCHYFACGFLCQVTLSTKNRWR